MKKGKNIVIPLHYGSNQAPGGTMHKVTFNPITNLFDIHDPKGKLVQSFKDKTTAEYHALLLDANLLRQIAAQQSPSMGPPPQKPPIPTFPLKIEFDQLSNEYVVLDYYHTVLHAFPSKKEAEKFVRSLHLHAAQQSWQTAQQQAAQQQYFQPTGYAKLFKDHRIEQVRHSIADILQIPEHDIEIRQEPTNNGYTVNVKVPFLHIITGVELSAKHPTDLAMDLVDALWEKKHGFPAKNTDNATTDGETILFTEGIEPTSS